MALTLSLKRLKGLFNGDQSLVILVHDLLADLADELLLLNGDLRLGLHLAKLLLEQLVLLGADLLDVKLRVTAFVVSHQVCVAGEKLGALMAFGQFNWASDWLAQYLLIGLKSLLLDFDVGFGLNKKFLLGAHLAL